ncbi:cell division protein ZipA C-terminal FtsZ-binding domain-containing protein [Gammaproteobacteria bacterium]|jgi:FtsZ-interacting cell division protein ZipA|nr:cell division protein ZipA C-terminal FtsZ-binding domain-containing protein [Gammaproteobacteria bacterium]MDC0570226.1 cell division protein ZipA C-terminal FtsZ-binding domain-containing protein [bacterium]MDA8816113.1 cell division protein ZipA C-terminal FtsZ-binding domain-containing protein [Gammaproteobacteria bacterium]MDA9570944.1 cell division protein ZipA C-terminal FtsZ-binding domain-containing protein [Gammaproteobacteria bacterium]MDA9575228.1 cell division protein ZipA C-ter
MEQNIDIYLIGLSVLIFLIITFLFIRKISSSGDLKVKIEPVTDSFEIKEIDEIELKSQKAFDFNEHDIEYQEQKLVVLNLISNDKSMFDIDQIYGFMTNSNAILTNGFFVIKDTNNKESFRIANALNPGTFENETETFAILLAADLNNVSDPLSSVKEMVNFAYQFSEKFYANICDQERMPISKQMISHIESQAQEIMRLKQLSGLENK